MRNIDEKDIEKDMEIQKKIFDIRDDRVGEAGGISRLYLALKRYVSENNIQSYAPDCWPELRDNDKTPICPVNGRMHEHSDYHRIGFAPANFKVTAIRLH